MSRVSITKTNDEDALNQREAESKRIVAVLNQSQIEKEMMKEAINSLQMQHMQMYHLHNYYPNYNSYPTSNSQPDKPTIYHHQPHQMHLNQAMQDFHQQIHAGQQQRQYQTDQQHVEYGGYIKTEQVDDNMECNTNMNTNTNMNINSNDYNPVIPAEYLDVHDQYYPDSHLIYPPNHSHGVPAVGINQPEFLPQPPRSRYSISVPDPAGNGSGAGSGSGSGSGFVVGKDKKRESAHGITDILPPPLKTDAGKQHQESYHDVLSMKPEFNKPAKPGHENTVNIKPDLDLDVEVGQGLDPMDAALSHTNSIHSYHKPNPQINSNYSITNDNYVSSNDAIASNAAINSNYSNRIKYSFGF